MTVFLAASCLKLILNFLAFLAAFLNGHFLLNLLATLAPSKFYKLGQGILKGEVSLYH